MIIASTSARTSHERVVSSAASTRNLYRYRCSRKSINGNNERSSQSLLLKTNSVKPDRFEISLTGQEEDANTNTTTNKVRTISLDLGGKERQQTKIEYDGQKSELLCVEIKRPLGIVLEEKRKSGTTIETNIEVVEIVQGSNADEDGRVKVGDVLRLTTAVFNVSAPVDVTTWMNPPAKANVRAFVKNASFDKTMLAIKSHSVQVDYDGDSREMETVAMVFERRK
jgi:hypothetical protein